MSWLKVPFIAVSAMSIAASLQAAPQASTAKSPASQPVKKSDFKSFTGKVAANKVRLRVKPDLESHIIRQVNKNDLLLVVGEQGDFYAVQPPKDTKAYVFRSYILDDVVEANRVNVRLEPHVDGAIIGQLQGGDRVKGQVCPMNHKWLEIPAPATTKFYVSKEFLTQAGGPDYMATMEKRKTQVEEQLSAAFLAAETECKKEFEAMSPQPIIEQFQTILHAFTDFPDALAQAKEGLALLKDTYIQKKISYLESKAQLSDTAKEEILARHKAESQELFAGSPSPTLFSKRAVKREMTDGMRFWDTIEESLYLSWTAFHSGRKMDDFYAEQKANAAVLTGTVEAYDHPVKNRPGDYVLRGQDSPMAYLYSTAVNLEKYEGKKVTLLASPRPNNHFAFPAYFVLSVE
jgi:uncharacterized protein YgiM (DUF1202 family)